MGDFRTSKLLLMAALCALVPVMGCSQSSDSAAGSGGTGNAQGEKTVFDENDGLLSGYLVQDASHLYFLYSDEFSPTTLRRLSKSTEVVEVVAPEVPGGSGLAAGGGFVLVGTPSGPLKWTASTNEVSYMDSGRAGTIHLDASSTYAYWESTSQDSIQRQLVAGGATESVLSGEPTLNDFAVGPTHLYWRSSSGIKRAQLGGGASEVFSPEFGGDLLVADGYLFWKRGFSEVLRTPVAGGPSESVWQGDVSSGTMIVDSGNLYFTAGVAGSTIVRIDLATLDAKEHQVGGGFVREFVVDASHVYYNTCCGIYRLEHWD